MMQCALRALAEIYNNKNVYMNCTCVILFVCVFAKGLSVCVIRFGCVCVCVYN